MLYSAVNLVYEKGTVQTVAWSLYFLAFFLALFEHKQVSGGLDSNKKWSLYKKTLSS